MGGPATGRAQHRAVPPPAWRAYFFAVFAGVFAAGLAATVGAGFAATVGAGFAATASAGFAAGAEAFAVEPAPAAAGAAATAFGSCPFFAASSGVSRISIRRFCARPPGVAFPASG